MATRLYPESRTKNRRKYCECGRDRYYDSVAGRWEKVCRWCLELESRGYGSVLPDYEISMQRWIQEQEVNDGEI